uniref:THO complex subunit 7 homolog n=1 Tax=Salmo trutta TaxID=8032 RepID=A0A674EB14_SALTR
MGAVTDGDFIWKHLLIDGDGAGDNQSINVLLKNFTKWCNSTGLPEEGFTQYQRIYEKIYTDISERNETGVSEIQRAKRIQNNQQCEVDRLQQLSHIKENVGNKLELRKKQFHVLLCTIQELQQTLEKKNDTQESSMENECTSAVNVMKSYVLLENVSFEFVLS